MSVAGSQSAAIVTSTEATDHNYCGAGWASLGTCEPVSVGEAGACVDGCCSLDGGTCCIPTGGAWTIPGGGDALAIGFGGGGDGTWLGGSWLGAGTITVSLDGDGGVIAGDGGDAGVGSLGMGRGGGGTKGDRDPGTREGCAVGET